MQCARCKECFSPSQLVLNALEHRRDELIPDGSDSHVPLPLSPHRMDTAVMRHSHDSRGGCTRTNNPFWDCRNVRDIVLRDAVDAHDVRHRPRCFKHSSDCCFELPDKCRKKMRICTDKGSNGENFTNWPRLAEGDTLEEPPWRVENKRPMGCQCTNTHNKHVSECFCCNTNVQIGDRAHVFCCTCCCSKCTNLDDNERRDRTTNACMEHLLRVQEKIEMGLRDPSEIQSGFVEGLCLMLSAMNASCSRDNISAPMQHRLVHGGVS